jgi:hypothetical protein
MDFPRIADAEHLLAEALPAAGIAGEGDVREELHLDELRSRSAALRAASIARVEREGGGIQPGRGRLRRRGEELPHALVHLRVGGGVPRGVRPMGD